MAVVQISRQATGKHPGAPNSQSAPALHIEYGSDWHRSDQHKRKSPSQKWQDSFPKATMVASNVVVVQHNLTAAVR